MILLHALEAPYDIPGIGIMRGDTMYHLLSDVPGTAGTAELLLFVRASGGRDNWLQSPGTYREHFDIFGEWVDRARALGAREAMGREIAAILTAKRVAMAVPSLAVPTITSRQMRAVDAMMATTYGIDVRQMLELAGTRVAEFARRMLGGSAQGKRVVVLAGPGKNGSGGLVAARHLVNAGAQVQVWMLVDPQRLDGVASDAITTLAAMGLAPHFAHIPDVATLAASDLLVDALLGYSIAGPPHGMLAATIINANASGTPILALDLPSGLDADDAGPFTPCIHATSTLTLALPKRGLVLDAAQAVIGELWLADIGVPRRLFKRVGTRVGTLFAQSPLIRLERTLLAGEELASAVGQWRVAAE